jgi:hypothetical protein
MQGGQDSSVDLVDDALSILFDIVIVAIPVMGGLLIIYALYDIIYNDILKKRK